MRQRTMLINTIHGHSAEVGVVAPQGARQAVELIEGIRRDEIGEIPQLARTSLLTLADQLGAIAVQIHGLERRLLAWHRQDKDSQRLATASRPQTRKTRGVVGAIVLDALRGIRSTDSVRASGRQFRANRPD